MNAYRVKTNYYLVDLVNPRSSYLSLPDGMFTFISNADCADYTDAYGMNAYRVRPNYYLVNLVNPWSSYLSRPGGVFLFRTRIARITRIAFP